MSVCTFIAANVPLPTVVPAREYPVEINVDTGEIFDGGADDNFYLQEFGDVSDYTDKKYGVWLDWNPTPGRAERILRYIQDVLQVAGEVELWHVWLLGYHEFEDRPVVKKRAAVIGELTAGDILELDDAEIWNHPDRQYPERPSFYLLTVKA
ncbi:MAG: hypothetical protein IKU17_08285 [Clostridia bacterium]|nr:hypothetical protein [Clostridia bacterium]